MSILFPSFATHLKVLCRVLPGNLFYFMVIALNWSQSIALWLRKLRRLGNPLRIKSVHAGSLIATQNFVIPVVISLEGTGILRVGSFVRFVVDGGTFCSQGRPGEHVVITFRNFLEVAEHAFEVPYAVHDVRRVRSTVPSVRIARSPLSRWNFPSFSDACVKVSFSPGRVPPFRVVIPPMRSIRTVCSDGCTVVHAEGIEPIHLVDTDEATLRRVAAIVARRRDLQHL